jgi:hypothetical protein
VSPVELTDGRGGEGGEGGAKSYDCKKVWASINHSILSDPPPFFFVVECRRRRRSGGYPYFFLTSRSGFIPLYVQTYGRFTLSGNR